MSDWDQFVADVSWFLEPSDTVEIGAARPWTRGPIEGLPELSALLGSASVTPVSVGDAGYELLAWGPPAKRRGWLCDRPVPDGPEVHHLHRSLWTCFGGIVERFGEPDSWWLNQNQVLTVAAAEEANGNLTLVRRASGELLLFAPDHSFAGVTPLPGCPPYSLLTIDEARDLAAWIEVCARAWNLDLGSRDS